MSTNTVITICVRAKRVQVRTHGLEACVWVFCNGGKRKVGEAGHGRAQGEHCWTRITTEGVTKEKKKNKHDQQVKNDSKNDSNSAAKKHVDNSLYLGQKGQEEVNETSKQSQKTDGPTQQETQQ